MSVKSYSKNLRPDNIVSAVVGSKAGLAHPDARQQDVHPGRPVPAGPGGQGAQRRRGGLGPHHQIRHGQGHRDLRMPGKHFLYSIYVCDTLSIAT